MLAMVGAAAWYATSTTNKKGDKESAAPQPIQVEVATAQLRDLPVEIYGLGTVQGWNTVTIHTRVDGQIEKVAFEEGQLVKQGDLLLQIDARPFKAVLEQAIAKKNFDEAVLENSRRDLERFKRVGTLANSQQQIDTQQALVAQQEAQVKADQGAIDNARVQLGYTTIVAPISGRMGFRLVDRGNIVHASDAQGVAVIAEMQPIAVVFTTPQEELPRITAGLQAGPLPVIALSSDGKTVLEKGTVSLIDNRIDASGSVRLKAKFDNIELKLWPGLTVATKLQIETLKDVVVIPDAAVQRGPQYVFAYVVDEQQKVQLAPLQLGKRSNGLIVIKEGLAAGAKVVVGGFYQLQPGSPVRSK